MSKYTPATELAIKRDVQKAQRMLVDLHAEIEIKKEQKAQLDKELLVQSQFLEGKRGFIAKFEDMITGVYTQGLRKIKSNEERVLALGQTISQLETARDLVSAEIALRQEKSVEPAGAVLVQSLISQLEPILDKLLTDIEISEKHLNKLQTKAAQFEKANKKLATEAQKQEQRVANARLAVEQANLKRQKCLQALVQEEKQLSLIRTRERDSSAMERRLSKEYLAVYKKVPRRGNKKTL